MVLLGEVSDSGKEEKQTTSEPKQGIAYVDSLVYGSTAAARELPEVSWIVVIEKSTKQLTLCLQYEMLEEPMPADTAYQLVHDELEVSSSGGQSIVYPDLS
jgi:hypothetical protein